MASLIVVQIYILIYIYSPIFVFVSLQVGSYKAPSSFSFATMLSTSSTLPPPCLEAGSISMLACDILNEKEEMPIWQRCSRCSTNKRNDDVNTYQSP